MTRLLNDSYMRRGTQVDLANLGQASQAMQEAFGEYRGRRPHMRVKSVVKEYHRVHLTQLHAMPKKQIATKLWVSELVANGGILQVVISAWQAFTESWRATTVGIQEKWEATQNHEAVPTNIMPLEYSNIPTRNRAAGRPDRRAANWTLDQAKCRRFARWRRTTPD